MRFKETYETFRPPKLYPAPKFINSAFSFAVSNSTEMQPDAHLLSLCTRPVPLTWCLWNVCPLPCFT